jgi:1-acyl-sn-glycerol-3-phosphate acyltransferase
MDTGTDAPNANQSRSSHCIAITQAGRPCKNKALPDSTYCHVHQPSRSEAEPELPDPEQLRQLADALNELATRIQLLSDDYRPPPFSMRRWLKLIDESFEQLSPDLYPDLRDRLYTRLNENLLNRDTVKALWYMFNYTLQYQRDFVKRRLTGQYETDEWGLDWEFLEAVRPFFEFMYRTYWRVECSGLEHMPDHGRTLLVCNHSGQLPWDNAMVGTALYLEHPAQRLVRGLYATWFSTLPFISAIFTKLGQTLATVENGTRLLEQEELVAVYPEGYKGVGKLFKDRYRLARFGRGGFVKMALQTQAPIIPVAVVGAEETYITLAKSRSLAQLTGFPYFPISPFFPWLGPLGLLPLPAKWYIDFGPPIPMDSYESEANSLMLISRLNDQVRDTIQEMINERLAQRRSVFLG